MAIYLAALLLTLSGLTQPPAAQPPGPPITRETARYVIGPQDQLAITVYDEPDLTNRYRVDDAGFVSFPLISRPPAWTSTSIAVRPASTCSPPTVGRSPRRSRGRVGR